MKNQYTVCLVLSLVLIGCTGKPVKSPPRPEGQVGISEVDSAVPQSTRLQLGDNETFQQPLPASGNAIPVYPEPLLAQRLPAQALCLRVSIDETGAVSDTMPLATGPDCPEIERVAPDFFEAAHAAARTWRFDPAFRCVYPEGPARDLQGACWGEGARQVPQAVSLVYRFVFEQIDGKGAVRLGAGGPNGAKAGSRERLSE